MELVFACEGLPVDGDGRLPNPVVDVQVLEEECARMEEEEEEEFNNDDHGGSIVYDLSSCHHVITHERFTFVRSTTVFFLYAHSHNMKLRYKYKI